MKLKKTSLSPNLVRNESIQSPAIHVNTAQQRATTRTSAYKSRNGMHTKTLESVAITRRDSRWQLLSSAVRFRRRLSLPLRTHLFCHQPLAKKFNNPKKYMYVSRKVLQMNSCLFYSKQV
uniref:Uncharacterized protein n=1 Tax=Schistocephalus solidus TaxID=70667 RepID=A0A0X3NTR2_SCHSO